MSETTKRYVLHYGGEKFNLRDKGLLDDYDGGSGTISVHLENGDWITIAVGDGIPIAIVEQTVRRPVVGTGRTAFSV